MRSILQVLRHAIVAFVIALTLQTAASAQTIDAAAIDRIMEEALKVWEVPGASVAIVRGDEVVYLKGFGTRELGGKSPVTPDTLFAIGSTTKAFTTTAMAMLVDEGKMQWDDPVRKHVEFFHLSDPLADQQVTLRDIVSHRTGLSRHDLLWYGSPWSREEIIRRIGQVKLTEPFRSLYQYQNIMFLTAGYAVGRVAGTTWEDFLQKRIFDPLGMTGANFSSKDAERAPDHASPHVKNKDGKVIVIPWRNLDNCGPAGSINASARDMSRWVRFQLGGGMFEGKRLVSARNLEETHTPQMVVRLEGLTASSAPHTTQMSYGLAWFIQDHHGQLMVSHTGGIDGFRARVVLIPKAKIGLVILTNSGVGTSSTSMHVAATNSIVDYLLGLPKTDWNAFLYDQFKKIDEAGRAAETAAEARRHKDTRPSRELTSYAGAYEDPAYGRATVSVEQGGLVLQWSNFKSRLEHYHYDTFKAVDDNSLENQRVVFKLGADGEVAALGVLGVDFKRVKARAQTAATAQ
jgi:CubicO group peptidase (beta-lactamase class C family)